MRKKADRKTTDVDLEIGRKIELYRKIRSKTRQWLGKKIDRTYQQIQNYEIGNNRVSASVLVQIAVALNYPVETFFPDKDFEEKRNKIPKEINFDPDKL